MDEIAAYNVARWEALVRARAVFTRPYLDLDAVSAAAVVDPEGLFGTLAGKAVLCLAGGGGQQSAAFALLGARVTVADLSPAQLAGDREAARHLGVRVETVQADMRELSALPAAAYDLVYHAYSLNFVPDVMPVFRGVSRVLAAGGVYYFNCANPYTLGLSHADWDGQGYPLCLPYADGAEVRRADEAWVFRGEMPREPVAPPVEYRHTLGRLVNGLAEAGFVLWRLQEEHLSEPDYTAAPGTTEHFTSVAPPWLRFWARYEPRGFAAARW